MFLGVFVSLQAQNKQILYGFKEVPQQILLNPGAQIDYNGYIGVPLLSHIHFNAGITGFSAFDIFADDGRDFNQKIQDVVYDMDAKDFFGFPDCQSIVFFQFFKKYVLFPLLSILCLL